MKNIENNDINSCSNALGIDLENKLKMQFAMQDTVSNIKNINYQILLQETKENILMKSKIRKNFKVSFGNQNIHINLESKIPFILITPSQLQDGQTLVMESNNIEIDKQEDLLMQGLGTGKDLNDILKRHNNIIRENNDKVQEV